MKQYLLVRSINLQFYSIRGYYTDFRMKFRDFLLKIDDFDNQRMLIHIKNAKGGKERYALLAKSTRLILWEYYLQYRPKVMTLKTLMNLFAVFYCM